MTAFLAAILVLYDTKGYKLKMAQDTQDHKLHFPKFMPNAIMSSPSTRLPSANVMIWK